MRSPNLAIALLFVVPAFVGSYMLSGLGWRGLKPTSVALTSDRLRRNMVQPKPWSVPVSNDPQTSATLSDEFLFCNRELNMNQVQAVGFDMDYTLAQYKEEFDLLAYTGARTKLIEWMKYPKEIEKLNYTPDITRRGCMVDKKRGNVLKLDQHRYVRAVEHGLTPLSREERKAVYRSSYQDTERFTGSGYSNIDTPFSLVDACLYAQLVDYKDSLSSQPAVDTKVTKQENTLEEKAKVDLLQKSYADVWNDLRVCVERCHRDGTIKLAVALDPARYIVHDPNLFPMLSGLRRAGKKVFLLTNSLFDYTQVVMSHMYQCFLRDQHESSGQRDKVIEKPNNTWMDYFDVIIAGGNKPAFLLDEGSLTLFKVNPADNTLANCGSTPQSAEQGARFLQQHGKVFQGGNAQILHHLLQITPPLVVNTGAAPRESAGMRNGYSNGAREGSGGCSFPELDAVTCSLDSAECLDDESPVCQPAKQESLSNAGRDGGLGVLYVGDHIYADILRSKRSLGWRTCLIVPELSAELQALGGEGCAEQIVGPEGSGEKAESATPSLLDPQQLKDELCRLKETQSLLESELDELQCTYYHYQLHPTSKFSTTTAAHTGTMETPGNTPQEARCSEIIAALQRVRADIRETLAAYDAAFHPRWGQLFRAGFQESRISKQIKDYACVYTSKASNLAGVSHVRPLRPTRDLMPHDHFIAGLN